MKTPRLLGPWLLLVLGVAGAVGAVAWGQLRAGGFLLAATLFGTALLRAILPVRIAGAIAVRSRPIDVLLLCAAGVAAATLAATLKLTV